MGMLNYARLKRLRDLNIQLLELLLHGLYLIERYCREHGLLPPREFLPLMEEVLALINEINAEIALPPNWQHRFRTPKDSTEP